MSTRHWKAGWKRARRQALERDDHLCCRCGRPAEVVHHLDMRAGNDLANLRSLCRDCHSLVHYGRETPATRRKEWEVEPETVELDTVEPGHMTIDTSFFRIKIRAS